MVSVRRALLVAVLALVAVPTGAGAASSPIHWESVLPDSPPAGPQHKPVAGCKKATLKCIDVQIRAMRRLQKALACDHRAVFTTTYLTLTLEMRNAAARRPSIFRDRRYLFREVTNFAAFYLRSIRNDDLGLPVPEAWRIAFDAARDGEVNAGQDMLLGINAHVQADMPFVMAKMGLVDRAGRSRKPDHDAGNEVLADAYQKVIDQVTHRYDPIMGTLGASWNPVEDVAALEMVRGWRELVWRNAERLVAAKDKAERAQVAASIQDQAAMWATGMATAQQPGYRATRDAYCAKALASRST